MQVPIDDIVVKKRIRKDMGDMASLAGSMKKYGLISPIVLTKNNVLIAGGRRLEAARSLGWRTINAVIAQPPAGVSNVELETEENFQRRDFSPGERDLALSLLNRLHNPGPLRRIWNALVRFFKWLFKVET